MTTSNSWYGWEKVRRIGRGGYGEVYEIHRTIGSHTEKAALKLIRIPVDAGEPEKLQRNNYSIASITKRYEDQREKISREYDLMRQLRNNPNIVQCNDIQFDPNPDGFGWQIGIRMELLTPLDRYLGQTITQQQVIDVGVQICNALIACKNNNILHRDIKADNILVAEDGTIKLGDFGIAKVSEFTAPGTSIGTPGFEAPEVYNHQDYGSSADLYSLGLVLYWMLNERTKPFLPLPPQAPTALQEEEARERRYRGEPLPPPKNGSQELKQVVLKATAYHPRDRYASAWDMQQALLAVSGNSSFYGGNTGTAGRTAYSQRPVTGGWGNTTGGNTQYGYTSGSYTAGGNTGENSQYRYTRGSGETTFGNSWTERTQGQNRTYGQERTNSGWTQTNASAEKTTGASFYSQPGAAQNTAPKAPPKAASRAAAPVKQYSSATKKKPLGRKILLGMLLFLVLDVIIAGIFMLKEKGYFDGGGSSTPIFSGSIPGVEITDIPGDDANTLVYLGSFEGSAYISNTSGLSASTGSKIHDLSSHIYTSDYAYVDAMLNYLGQDTYGLSVIRSDNLGEDLIAVQAAVNEVNGMGLINLSGEVLLQPQAAAIDWPNDMDTGRYLLVAYATDEASLGGDWQVASNGGFRYTKKYYSEGKKYQGYTKVYNLVNRQFVPGIQFENFDWGQVQNHGDYFAVLTQNKDYSEAVVVYNADGMVVSSYDQISSISDYAIDVDGDNAGIYDFNGNKLWGDETYHYGLMENYVIRSHRETSQHTLMDLGGNVLLESGGNPLIPWDYSYLWLYDNQIITCNEDDSNGLMALDGREILPCSYSYINYLGSGYFEATRKTITGNYVHTLVGDNGVIAEDINDSGHDLIYVDNGRALVLNNRSFDLQLGESSYWNRLGTALIAYEDPETGLWCVYDLFTGNQLLPSEYTEINAINGQYLYAKKDGVYEVYEIQSTFDSNR